MKVHDHDCEPWTVTLLETGLNTMTGGRIKCAAEHIGNESFLLTYGDGVSDVDISATVAFHKEHKKAITMTAVQPAGRYGALSIENHGKVSSFLEKPKGDGAWINGGFFICEPSVLDYIEGNDTVFEQEPLTNLANDGELYAFHHDGFWECMDTLRDKTNLSKLWDNNEAPWKKWK